MTTVDTFIVASVSGKTGKITLGQLTDPKSSHCAFPVSADLVDLIQSVEGKAINMVTAGPKPTVDEALNFLKQRLPAGWSLETKDQLQGVHRITQIGWIPGSFAFGFAVKKTGAAAAYTKTSSVSNLAAQIDFLAVVQEP